MRRLEVASTGALPQDELPVLLEHATECLRCGVLQGLQLLIDGNVLHVGLGGLGLVERDELVGEVGDADLLAAGGDGLGVSAETSLAEPKREVISVRVVLCGVGPGC